MKLRDTQPSSDEKPETADAATSNPTKSKSLISSRRLRLGILLASVWGAVIAAVWFGLHPLFEVEFPLYPAEITGRIAGALGGGLADIGLLGLVAVGSGAAGWWGLRLGWRGVLARLNGWEIGLISLGLGLGLNIMLILGIGLVGGVNRLVAYGLLIIELTLLWPHRAMLGRVGHGWQSWKAFWKTARWWEKGLVVWLAGVAAATLLLALAPPLAWDALMYHLEGPRRYIEAGRIEPLPRLGQASFPFGAEMLFTWGMLLRSDGLAQAFSWLFGIMGAAGCGIFARRFFVQFDPTRQRQAGLLAAALYLSIPHVWLLMTWAYTDTMLTFYNLLAFFLLLLAVEVKGRTGLGYSTLAGIMAGLSCGGKYTAVLGAIGVLFGAAVYGALRSPRPTYRQLALGGLAFGMAGALSFAPWLVRNSFFSGNPVAPLFFGIKDWSPEEIAALTGKDGGVDLSPAVIFGRPFQVVLTGRDNGLFDATISPVFLALLPLGVWVAWRERVIAALWLAIGLTYAGWLVGIKLSAAADHTRLMLQVFPLLALVTAYGLLDFTGLKLAGSAVLGWVARLVVIGFLLVSAFSLTLTYVANDPLPYHFGFQSRAERIENQLGAYYRAARFVNEQTPQDAKLFMFFEPRGYYFERQLSPDHNSGGQFFYYQTNYQNPPAVYSELRKRGATYVLVNETLLGFLINTPEYKLIEKAKTGRQLLNDLQAQGYFERVFEEKGNYTIYRLKSLP